MEKNSRNISYDFSKKRKNRSKLKLIFSFLAGTLLLITMLWWIGLDRLISVISRASPFWLILTVFTIPVAYLVRAWRWKILLTPVKNPVKMSNMFWATTVGFMVNIVVPVRLGEFVRAYIVGEKENMDFASSFSSIIVERTLDLIGILTIGFTVLALLPIYITTPQWFTDSFIVVSIFVVVIVVVLVLGVKKEEEIVKLVDRILDWLHFSFHWKEKIHGFVQSLINGTKSISQGPKFLTVTLTLTWILWLIQLTGVYFIFRAFNYQAHIMLIFLGAVVMYLTHILPAVPGYVGTYEAYWMLIFLGLGLTRMDFVLTMGLVSHLLGVVTMLVMGCLGVMWLGLSFEEIFKIDSLRKTDIKRLR